MMRKKRFKFLSVLVLLMMAVDAARDALLKTQIQVNFLTSIKSGLEKILSEAENGA